MTRLHGIAALLGLALAAAPLPAQGVIISSPGPYYGYPVGGAFISFGRGHFHGGVGFPLGGYYAPPGYGYNYTSTQVTVVYSPPPPVIVLPPPDVDDLNLELLRQRLREDDLPPARPPQGEQHFGGFRRVDPKGNPLPP